MRAFPGLLLLVPAAAVSLTGCPPCPRDEPSTPSLSSAAGGLEVVDANGTFDYTLSSVVAEGADCLVRGEVEAVDGDDIDAQVRPTLRIECRSGPLFLVHLPDLRATEPSADPVPLSFDATFGVSSAFAISMDPCVVRVTELPMDLTVQQATGGPGVEPELVTPDFRRDLAATLQIDGSAQPGTREDGSTCVVQVPELTLDLQVTLTSGDFGAKGGGGCG